MAGQFGDPAYVDESAAASRDAAGSTQAAAPSVDPDDPRLNSEVLSDDTARDAYEIPPPAPDGLWRARLKLVPIKDDKQQDVPYRVWLHANVQSGRPMFVANVEAVLIDIGGRFDGIRVQDAFVKSLIDSRSGTSQMSTIVQKAGGELPKSSTDRARVELLVKTLAGEPEVIIATQWETSCRNCRERAEAKHEKAPKPFLYDMARFPQPRPGIFDPTVKCPTCSSLCRAQVRIARYYSVKEIKATRGLAAA